MDRGELVPDDITIAMVMEALGQPAARAAPSWTASRAPWPRRRPWTRPRRPGRAHRPASSSSRSRVEELVVRVSGRWVCPTDGTPYHAMRIRPRSRASATRTARRWSSATTTGRTSSGPAWRHRCRRCSRWSRITSGRRRRRIDGEAPSRDRRSDPEPPREPGGRTVAADAWASVRDPAWSPSSAARRSRRCGTPAASWRSPRRASSTSCARASPPRSWTAWPSR